MKSSIWSGVTAGSLVFDKREIISVERTTTVSETLDVLDQHNILSVPVRDGNEFIGLVGTMDIMPLVAFAAVRDGGEQRLEVLNWPISELIGVTRECRSTRVFPASEPVESLARALGHEGVHRVAVRLDCPAGQSEAYRLVTQTDVLRFLSAHIDQHIQSGLEPNVARSIEELQLWKPDQEVACVTLKQTALEAFQSLEKTLHSCVAVVSEDGAIATQISASDLRGLKQKEFVLLEKSVEEFLRLRRHTGRLIHPVVCNVRTPLSEVMLKMVVARVHRVWVVDASQKPIGVVSMTDIIALFAPSQ